MATLTSMKLVEFTDRALLGVLTDVADGDGHATAEAIATKLGIKADNPVQCVRMRLAWLKRYGMVESHPQKGEETTWSMTKRGRDLYTGRLKASAHTMLERLEDGEVWMAAALVTGRYDTMEDSLASMVRRDFSHVQQRRIRRMRGG